MTELQQNRYDQLLRRVGDLKGPGSKVNDSLSELFPMFDVENVPAELLLLSGSRLCMARTFTAAGGAGKFGVHLLRNNGDTNAVARLMQVSIAVGVDQGIVCGPTQNSGTAQGTRAFADGRVFGEGTTLVTQADNTGLVPGSTFFEFDAALGQTNFWEPPSAIGVITPGTAFSVGNNSSNVALTVSWLWIERVAQESELNL